ncbi:2491_t:CDS:2 [Funneliformis geosporum]|uniref:2491_t:CDS:1 n=1 Tax=Funneliformis geosporum TaxID=1117311 RepID=A0A9W4T3N5_9GLOM|nr:2491_t:CDS:2 [Funneliformis geosporum]
MAIEHFPKLSQNFSQLLDDAEDYDVVIRVGKNSNVKEFRAHSIILKSRSTYFKRALSQNWITKKDNLINFNKPNISPIIFGMIIRYLYSGKIDLNEKDGSDMLELILASDKLLLDELVTSRKRSNSRIPKDSKYNFSLIYQGSRDGFDTNIMRRNCNGQGACILIIKTNENGTIIGGYNPIGWKYYEHIMHGDTYWSNTTESFIFSMGDGSDLNDFKISRVVNSNCAIFECNNQNILLNFGNSDLVINNNTGTCNRHCYESSILDANNFTIKEMEIHKFISGE